MQVREALEQLDTIHDHLTRAEVYRGFKVPGVALVGVVGIAAAALQPSLAGSEAPFHFVMYWLAVAGAGALVGGGAAVHAYAVREDEFARRKTRRVLAQFLPGVFAGALLTAAFLKAGPELLAYLPGLWAVVFGLGVIASRPYLPKGIGLVGLGYVLAGGALLGRVPSAPDLSGWSVGGVFGLGHFATAFVLWCDRARECDA